MYSILIHCEALYSHMGRGEILSPIRGCYKHKTLQEYAYSYMLNLFIFLYSVMLNLFILKETTFQIYNNIFYQHCLNWTV